MSYEAFKNLEKIPDILEKLEALENKINSLTNKNDELDLTRVTKVSKYLGVTNKTIYNYIDNGIFKEYVHFKRVLNKKSVRIRFINNAIINFKKGL